MDKYEVLQRCSFKALSILIVSVYSELLLNNEVKFAKA